MIVKITTYGVLLTTEYGKFYEEFSEFKHIKPHEGYGETDDYGNKFLFPHLFLEYICASCPSDEEDQFVLGFGVKLNKNTNVKEIHEEWLNYMENLPPEIKSIVENIRKVNPDLLEPDFYTLTGNC